MSHLLKTTLLGFLFLCCLDAGAATNTAVIVVSQTPESVRAMEGAEFTITCTFNTSRRSNKWFVEWYKDSTDVTAKLSNGTDGIIQHVDKDKKVSSLTVRKAKAEDSGTYLCEFGFFTGARANGSGTQVTIQEITDLMVNQTPANFSDFEGSELTMNCTFKTTSNHSAMSVRWYRYGTEGLKEELVKGWDVLPALHLENGFASLTLKNMNLSNAGNYLCEVGSTARNLSGNGTGTLVTIEKLPELTVNQTPAEMHESEGAELTLKCHFTALKRPNRLYVKWYKHNGSGEKKELGGEGGVRSTELGNGRSTFTLKHVNITDSGTYVCEVGSTARNVSASGAGSRVTITAVDLLVNQTPAVMNGLEGENLTIECRFKVMKDSSATYRVTWYKSGLDGHEKELKNGTGGVTTALDSLKGLASLTLIKVNRNDSGLYRCDFGKNGRGDKTRVTIPAHDPGLMNTYIVSGAVAGALLLLLLLCILLWRWRPCSKEPVQKGPEAEMNPVEPPSPPADEVTYADLNFLKRDAKETEDIYAKVKIRPKQREDNATSTNINPHHR